MKTATAVISALKQIFRTHGIPQKIHSDNGPPFDSQAYLSFLKSYDIQSIISSPRYPRSNGMIQRSIGTMKNILLKFRASGGDPNLAIFEYNNTPKFKLPSPAEMLMGRRLRSVVPQKTILLRPLFSSRSNTLKTKKVRLFHPSETSCSVTPKMARPKRATGPPIRFKDYD
ncbi:uncharacterized protein K02A2.6-like [Uloborus diversus]|uniref:uncharacterized protein K02A2.6-like n=1 Tax=Uloborus diversus TaxID=327109 RepID=UPI00240930AF|nr:uncharacterized protein K02A2.6-like [Uloborus diversus]